jgi:hypothetical protein
MNMEYIFSVFFSFFQILSDPRNLTHSFCSAERLLGVAAFLEDYCLKGGG